MVKEKTTKKNNKILFAITPFILATLVFLAVFTFSSPLMITDADTSNSELNYGSNVCVDVERADGTKERIGCKSNVVTNDGLNHIRKQLGQGQASTAFVNIGLCNATTPPSAPSPGCGPAAATNDELDNEWATSDGSGLGRAAGTWGQNGAQVGNWSVWNTFTSSYDNRVTNKTGIWNSSTSTENHTLLAENTFTAVTLQTNDQLTVNWTIWVE
jgi:hypothetical protein